jgi:hypothetical protein
LENFDNPKWIWWQWVGMILKKCESEVQERRKREGKQQATGDGFR